MFLFKIFRKNKMKGNIYLLYGEMLDDVYRITKNLNDIYTIKESY